MKTVLTRTVLVAALSLGMMGTAHGQSAERADPAKVKQVQRALEKNPELRENIFKALESQDERSLRRAMKTSGLSRQFETPAAIGGFLCLVDGIPYPQHVCLKYVRMMSDWTTW